MVWGRGVKWLMISLKTFEIYAKKYKRNAKKKTHRSMLKHNTWIMIKSDNWGGGGGFDPKVIIEWYRGRGGVNAGPKRSDMIFECSLSNSRLLLTNSSPHTPTHTFTHKHTYTTIHTYTHTYTRTHIHLYTHSHTSTRIQL